MSNATDASAAASGFNAKTVPSQPQAHLHWLFFDCMVDPDSRRYLSEDFAFCRRWRDMGGKVYVDLNSKLQHAGQHLYRGDLIESLKLQDRW
jgi:hypothetical protein